ncbi:MAG: S41 family peptidase [Lactobacillaceae bacterium]|jgi:hypothetical protein|nr:S41 family peptidase [Lactobacillaceae bacterium]
MKKASFSEIVNEGWGHAEASLFDSDDKRPQKDRFLTKKEQRKSLSIIACMISEGHAGYTNFDEASKKLFEERIEKIYNNAPELVKASELMRIVDASFKALPDKHLVLSNSDGNNPFYKHTNGNVGQNIAENAEKRYELSSREENGQKIGIIALPKSGIYNIEELMDFSKELKSHIFNPDGSEKFDSLIVDIRGNGGGSALGFEFVSSTLYGNEVQPCETASYRDTKQADALRCLNGELSKDEFNQRLANDAYTGENITVFDMKNYEETYPAFESGGYKKPISVLIDRNTGSAAESTCAMLRNHPGVTLIGENTSGCYEEVSGENSYPLPCGYNVKIATKHLSMPKSSGFEETKGFAPDINTAGKDAFDYALENIANINEDANNRINAHVPEKSSEPKEDQISITGAQYVRALRQGVDKSVVENLYKALNGEKKWNFIVKQSGIETGMQQENTRHNSSDNAAEQMLNKKIMSKKANGG